MANTKLQEAIRRNNERLVSARRSEIMACIERLESYLDCLPTTLEPLVFTETPETKIQHWDLYVSGTGATGSNKIKVVEA